ncbi:MAG: hypothetical protein A07HB70_00578 [uncultured archaeon A07HB70]|nr:MAG: hypothetical protein A07HB70_00578 [uncultured archaeon A07HB70]
MPFRYDANSVVATTRSRAPTSQSVCAALGLSVTIRSGGADTVTSVPVASVRVTGKSHAVSP